MPCAGRMGRLTTNRTITGIGRASDELPWMAYVFANDGGFYEFQDEQQLNARSCQRARPHRGGDFEIEPEDRRMNAR
jgi:hypothetical protein